MAIPGYTGDSSYGSVTFLVDAAGPDPLQRPLPPVKNALVVTPIPGSSTNDYVIQNLGREPQQFTVQITLYSSLFGTLTGLLGTANTLSIVNDTPRTNAVLEQLADVWTDDLNGLTFCKATWRCT